jgi:hypothetical protein
MAQAIYSNRGELIDFDHMMAQQGKTVAVGNTNLNARGDIVGPGGVIVKTAEQIISEQGYNQRPAEPVRKASITELAKQVELPSMYETTTPAVAAKNKKAPSLVIDTSKGVIVDDFKE